MNINIDVEKIKQTPRSKGGRPRKGGLIPKKFRRHAFNISDEAALAISRMAEALGVTHSDLAEAFGCALSNESRALPNNDI